MKRLLPVIAVLAMFAAPSLAAIIYSNTSNSTGYYYGEAIANLPYQDDFTFASPGTYKITKVTVGVYMPTAGNVKVRVYDKNWNLKSGDLTAAVTGTQAITWDLSAGGSFNLTDGGIIEVSFDTTDAGWLMYSPPTVGSNDNLFWIDGLEDGFSTLYAAFYAEIEGDPATTTLLNVDSFFPTPVNVEVNAPSGDFIVTPGSRSFAVTDSVSLTATASEGSYLFDYWYVDGVKHTENPVTLTMSKDRYAKAVYKSEVLPYPLYSNMDNLTGYYTRPANGVENEDDFMFEVPGTFSLYDMSVLVYVPDKVTDVRIRLYDLNKNIIGTATLEDIDFGYLWELTVNGPQPPDDPILMVDGGYIGVTCTANDGTSNTAGWVKSDPPIYGSNSAARWSDWAGPYITYPANRFGAQIVGLHVPVATDITVSGKVDMQDIVSQNSSYSYKATFKIYKSGNTNCESPDATVTANLDANGNYSFQIPPQGTGCTIVAKPGTTTSQDPTVRYHFLAKKQTNVDLSASITLPDFVVPNGDANDDNIVDAFDFTLVMQAYDIAEDTSLGETDLTNDGYVDAFDFTILMLTYDTAGDVCY